MASEDTVEQTFYAPWPSYGKALNKQWSHIRHDTAVLAPLVRGVGLDPDGDFSTLDSKEQTAMQSFELGEQDWHNKVRHYWNKDKNQIEIQANIPPGTSAVPHWYPIWAVADDGQVTQQTTPTTASNVGTGAEVFKQKSGVDLQFRTIKATGVLSVAESSLDLTLTSTAEANTARSDGGVSLVKSKAGTVLPFKGLVAGENMEITIGTNSITLKSTSQIVEFYGIVVAHSDDSYTARGTHVLKVNVDHFYLSPSGRSNETLLNLRGEIFYSEDFVAIAGDTMTGALLHPDGSEAAPAVAFSGDTDTGLARLAADDLALVSGGAAVLRALTDRVYLPKNLQIAGDGSAAAPDIFFFPDSDTGLFQPAADQLGFAAGGVLAGYFDDDQSFHVTNDVKAGHVEAGTGNFYTGLSVDGPILARPTTSTWSGSSRAIGPSDASDVGIAWETAGISFFISSEKTFNFLIGGSFAMTVSGAGITGFNNTVFAAPDGLKTWPSFRGANHSTTGMYFPSASTLGFSTDGKDAGYFDDDQNLFVTNKVGASIMEAGLGLFYQGVITVKESEIGGAAYFDNTVAFDSQRFYVSTGGDGKPLVSLNGSILTTDGYEGLVNLSHLNDGGLGDDESLGMTVTSDGATITLTITNAAPGKSATSPLEVQFEGQNYTYTPSGGAETLALTAGTDEVPVENFVAFELSGTTPFLAKSTTDWPSDALGEHHARVCTVVVQDAASVQTHGVLKIHAWTDHIEEVQGAGSGERGERGHLHSIAERLRNEPAVWRSGSSITVDNSGTTDPLYVRIEAGTGYQMHRHSSPVLDTEGSDLIFVVNDDTTPYTTIDRLNNLTRYATGGEGAIGVAHKFTVVLWMVVNENSGDTKLFLNVPTGGYNTVSAAKTDSDSKTVYNIPQAYVGTSILLYELVLGKSGGGNTWTVEDTVDLRGVPGVAIGGGGAATTGEVNAAANVGAGAGVFAQKTNEVLEFKSIRSKDVTIRVTSDADEIFLATTPDFYTPVTADRFLATQDGTVSDSAFSWTDDPNTGIYHKSSADQFAFVAGGVERMVVTSAVVRSVGPFNMRASKASAANLDFRWNSDADTGLFQLVAADNSFAFATAGKYAGHFDASQNLNVFNDLKSSRVEAGIGMFYTSLTVDGYVTVTSPFDIAVLSDSTGIFFGEGYDASIYYDGTNLRIDPQVTGSGYTDFTGAIFVAEDENDAYSRFGGAPTSVTPSDTVDKLVTRKERTLKSLSRRALLAVVDIDTDVAMTNSPQNYGLNAFVFTGEANTVSSTRPTAPGGFTGGRYSVRHKAAGTIAMGGGVASEAEITGAIEEGVITDGYAYLDEGGDGGVAVGGGGITNYRGLWILDSTGNITNKTCIHIEDQINSDNAVGILSEIGADIDGSRLFINHTGTAPSFHAGEFYIGDDLHLEDAFIRNLGGITFRDAAGPIAGIQNQNLLDKAAVETVSGAWTVSGVWDFDTTAPTVPDDNYDASNWDNDFGVPTKNAVRDKIEAITSGDSPYRFYLTVKQSDGLASFSDVSVINFEAANFYVIQNSSNTDEVMVNFRGSSGGGNGGGDGEINTASNLSPGIGLFAQKSSVDLQFKSLISKGASIALASTANSVSIDATGSFYMPVTVEGAAAKITVGSGETGNDSITSYYRDGVLAWSVGADHSENEFVITSGAMGGGVGHNEINLAENKIGFFNVAPAAKPAAYTPTNVTPTRTFNADAPPSNDTLADVLGTLIADLQSLGLIG